MHGDVIRHAYDRSQVEVGIHQADPKTGFSGAGLEEMDAQRGGVQSGKGRHDDERIAVALVWVEIHYSSSTTFRGLANW